MTRIAIALITCALIAVGCSGGDDDQTGMAVSETQSTSPGLEAGGEPGQTTQPEDVESTEVDSEESTPAVEDVVAEIIEPDGTATVEREGNTVRATVSGWEDRETPIWLVVVTPGDRHYPLRTFVTADGAAIWTETFIGSEDQTGDDFSLVVVSADEESLGATELERLFEERAGTTGLLAMPGVEELARQDVVRSG